MRAATRSTMIDKDLQRKVVNIVAAKWPVSNAAVSSEEI
jgi:hypothetical protein